MIRPGLAAPGLALPVCQDRKGLEALTVRKNEVLVPNQPAQKRKAKNQL